MKSVGGKPMPEKNATEDTSNVTFSENRSKGKQGIRYRNIKKTSMYIGVSLLSGRDRWRATINQGNKLYEIGYFTEEKHAAYAYDKEALQRYGESAKRNFPELSYEQLEELLAPVLEYEDLFNVHSRASQGRKQNRAGGTSSQYIGVTLNNKKTKRWSAFISKNRKRFFLGNHFTEYEAALVYDLKAKELFGDEAKLNFPDL
jgi:hypothetical protein